MYKYKYVYKFSFYATLEGSFYLIFVDTFKNTLINNK